MAKGCGLASDAEKSVIARPVYKYRVAFLGTAEGVVYIYWLLPSKQCSYFLSLSELSLFQGLVGLAQRRNRLNFEIYYPIAHSHDV
jgi:hypothetical protein